MYGIFDLDMLCYALLRVLEVVMRDRGNGSRRGVLLRSEGGYGGAVSGVK